MGMPPKVNVFLKWNSLSRMAFVRMGMTSEYVGVRSGLPSA
jgi:hypothetical protein